jgi:hypothetical protein
MMTDATVHEPIPDPLRSQLDALRGRPGEWHPLIGYHDPADADALAARLGTHPAAAGFAFGVGEGWAIGRADVPAVVSACYYGTAPEAP